MPCRTIDALWDKCRAMLLVVCSLFCCCNADANSASAGAPCTPKCGGNNENRGRNLCWIFLLSCDTSTTVLGRFLCVESVKSFMLPCLQVQRLSWFANWFDSLEEPPTAIIDGPNAAYMDQNHEHGGFTLKQVSPRGCSRRRTVCRASCFPSFVYY